MARMNQLKEVDLPDLDIGKIRSAAASDQLLVPVMLAPARTVGTTVEFGHDQILRERTENPPDAA